MSDKREINLESWKVADLKAELRKRHMDDDGNKETLLRRLKETLEKESGDLEQNRDKGGRLEVSKSIGILDQDGEEEEPVQIIKELHHYVPVQQTQETGSNLDLTQLMNFMQTMKSEIKNNMETMNEKMENSLKQSIEGIESRIQTNLRADIKKLTENLEKKYESHQNKLETLESKLEIVETDLSNMGENFDKRIKYWELKMDKQEEEVKEGFKDTNNRMSNNYVKVNARISEIQEEMRKGIQLNLDLSEEGNKMTERLLRKEISEKLKTGNSKENHSLMEDMKKQFEEKLMSLTKEISKVSDARAINDMSFQYLNYQGGKFDEGMKFCGDSKRIHPMNFIQTIKNKGHRIRDVQDLREFIRASLTGNALIWWNCKETNVQTMDDFEKIFVENFWSEAQQCRVRERLYFGRFNTQKSNLTTYALQLFAEAQFLVPNIPEGEIVMFISRHFKPEIKETIAVQNICRFDQLISYLSRIERNLNNHTGENFSRNPSPNRNLNIIQNRQNSGRNYDNFIHNRNQIHTNNVNNTNNRHNENRFGQNNRNNNTNNYRNNYNQGHYNENDNYGRYNNSTRNQNNYVNNRQNPRNVENSRNDNNRQTNTYNNRQVNAMSTTTTRHRSGSMDEQVSRQFRQPLSDDNNHRSRSSENAGRSDRSASPHFQ